MVNYRKFAIPIKEQRVDRDKRFFPSFGIDQTCRGGVEADFTANRETEEATRDSFYRRDHG